MSREMSPDSGCTVCRDLWRFFSDTDAAHKVSLGSFSEALSVQCPKHTPLVQQFRDYCVALDFLKTGPKDVGFVRGSSRSSTMLTQSVSMLGAYWNLLLARQDAVPGHIGTGRVLDPDWVDLAMAKRWKAECLSHHGTTCQNPLKVWPTRPAWLIDVEQKCIVPGEMSGPYIALSYRRGEEQGFTMNDDILGQLQQPGALDTPGISARLQPVIRRAMYLTSVLGERYLWADALCIVQGNYTSTEVQLNLMGAIYANALLSIIAADGDSQGGLTGLEGVSPPRELAQRIAPFGDEKIIVRNTNIFSMERGTPYYDRGWTYQELKLTSRKLLFNQKELHWQCQCSLWHEETTLGTEVDKYIDPRLSVITAGFPDLGALSDLVGTYNNRQLRYDEDALPGIFGLLSIVSRSFTGGFLYGLPEMFFERALGWTPYWKHTNLRRRAPSGRPTESRPPSALSSLPSWSWVGWQGLVGMATYGEAARINSRQISIEETIPVTEWYTSSQPSGAPLRRIRSTWYENRDAWKNPTHPLPDGWTTHPAPQTGIRGEPHLFPDRCGEHIFRHAKMPAQGTDDDEGWFYPFPVPEVDESTPPFMPEQTAYLICNTKLVRLWGFRAKNPDEMDVNLMEIRNADGKKVGSLHLHNDEQRSLFPEPGDEPDAGKPVDLVAIYKSRRYSKTWDGALQRYGSLGETTETYVVLWVEWKDEVAYRLASGQIEKKDWDDLELTDVSLVLG